jgi:hypothetical protein
MAADQLRVFKWFVDASFRVHPDYKSHTGMVGTMGTGIVASASRKQKLNTRSSTHAELVAANDVMTIVLWTKFFTEAQGYEVTDNIMYQDNRSAILLEKNGTKSAGSRSRALNIRYFFITDNIEQGHLRIEYCPTDAMLADYMTKPLQGQKSSKFRRAIMGFGT